MSYNLVDSTTGALTRVAGGTLYADLPIGSWIKNDMDTLPSGFLKEGDTILQSEYPELYAKYGSTVPYKADTSELSDYESITLPTTEATAMTMPYDGVYILANYGVSSVHHIWLNGSEISSAITGNSTTGASTSSTVPFKKGDKMYRTGTYSGSLFLEHVAYYKKSLIVKAKHASIPSDFIDAIDDAIADTTVDTVANGNMSPVTSNAVYDTVAPIIAVTSGTVTLSGGGTFAWYKYGRVVSARISYTSNVPASGTALTTLPANLRPVIDMNCKITNNGQNSAADISITTPGFVTLWYSETSMAAGFTGAITYITAS